MNKIKLIISLLFVFAVSLTSVTVGASSDEYIIINDVDHPKTVEQFKYELGVTDVEDGDISNNIYVIVDNYTGNEATLGDFIVVYGIRDSSGAEVSLAITIRNKDVRGPDLILVTENTLKIPQYSNLDSHLPNILAIDGFEGDITPSIQISGLGSIDTSVIGDYELTYTVADTSGNTTIEVFNVKVVDSTSPVLNGPTSIIKKSNVIMDGQFFLKYFTVNDDHDGDITSNLTIVSDEYTGNASNPGIYQVIVSVEDIAGNSTIQALTIEVKKDMLVQVIIDNYYWVVPNDHKITDDEFISILQSIEDLPNYSYIFTTQSDSYTETFESLDTFQKSFNLLSNTGVEFDRTIMLEVVTVDENIIIATPTLESEILAKAVSVVPWFIGIGLGIYLFKHRKKKKGY